MAVRKAKRRRQQTGAPEEAEEEAGEANSSSSVEGFVIVGTYEGALLGFRASDGAQTFGYAPHVGCVKALNCSQGGRMASGGTDHSVKLFDLSRGVELGELQEHADTVVCLDFVGTTTLITAGDDGQVCIWRCSDWELLLKFRGHKAAVACIAAHPSGRLMASAGRDRTVRLWDLTRGTSAASLSVDEVAEALEWSPTGDHLAVLSRGQLQVVHVRSCETAIYKDPSSGAAQVHFTAAMMLSDEVALLGDGKADVRVLHAANSSKGKMIEVCRLPNADGARRGRVKALVRGPQSNAADAKGGTVFVIGMSIGFVEVWRFAAVAGESDLNVAAFSRLHAVETGTRLTCLTAWIKPALRKPIESEVSEAAVAGAAALKKRRKVALKGDAQATAEA